MTELSNVALRAVDDAVSRPVVVYGSLPPEGRDLDLIVCEADLPAIEARLAGAGASRRGARWAFFGNGTAYAVELSPASGWRLPEPELQALFRESEPINGFRNIAKPAPHHALLLLARTGVSSKRQPRLQAALDHPGAWEKARTHAAGWGVDLSALQRQSRGATHRVLASSRAAAARVAEPHVVAFSGLDGAGKSTQVKMLASALQALGYGVTVKWSPILGNRSVSMLSGAAWGLLRMTRAPEGRDGRSLVAGRQSSSYSRRLVKQLWIGYTTAVNSMSLRGAALAARGSGNVVIYDRFVLDSLARIRFLYGDREPLRTQQAILRCVAPAPTAAFWLDVPPERAYARKPEQWTVADLTAQRKFYDAEYAKLSVERLDGERPTEELAAEIAARVWRLL